ncbi:unnamed protein product [Ectocarpus sp. 4 AP-2014]
MRCERATSIWACCVGLLLRAHTLWGCVHKYTYICIPAQKRRVLSHKTLTTLQSTQTHLGWWQGTSELWSTQRRRFHPNANICVGDMVTWSRAVLIRFFPHGDIVTSHR